MVQRRDGPRLLLKTTQAELTTRAERVCAAVKAQRPAAKVSVKAG